MAAVGIGLAIPGLINLTIQSVRIVAAKIQTYQKAPELLQDHFEVQGIQVAQLEICLDFVEDIAFSLTDELNAHLYKTVCRLHRSLEALLTTLERGTDKDGNIRRLWYTTLGRSALRRDLDGVEKDQVLFHRAVQLATLYGGPKVASYLTEARLRGNYTLARVQRLREAIESRLRNLDPNSTSALKLSLDRSDVPSGKRSRLSSSEIQLVMSENSEYPVALIENRPHSTDVRKIGEIALLLSGTDMSMAILPCRGFCLITEANRCELLFPLPRSLNQVRPRTLRDLLVSADEDNGVLFSLNSRITLARRIATAVLFTHTAKLVHKNIRPENIVIFETDNGLEIGDSFLMGYDFARKEDSASARVGDDAWYRNIYRHPQRQGVHPEVDFNMLHDIYSLGVVLLEIALWRSFVLTAKDASRGLKYVDNRLACRFFDKKSGKLKGSKEIWKELVRRAEAVVAPAMGYRYRDTVVMCLKCLDGGFGDTSELMDQDEVLVGLAYVERVLMTLDEIAV